MLCWALSFFWSGIHGSPFDRILFWENVINDYKIEKTPYLNWPAYSCILLPLFGNMIQCPGPISKIGNNPFQNLVAGEDQPLPAVIFHWLLHRFGSVWTPVFWRTCSFRPKNIPLGLHSGSLGSLCYHFNFCLISHFRWRLGSFSLRFWGNPRLRIYILAVWTRSLQRRFFIFVTGVLLS